MARPGPARARPGHDCHSPGQRVAPPAGSVHRRTRRRASNSDSNFTRLLHWQANSSWRRDCPALNGDHHCRQWQGLRCTILFSDQISDPDRFFSDPDCRGPGRDFKFQRPATRDPRPCQPCRARCPGSLAHRAVTSIITIAVTVLAVTVLACHLGPAPSLHHRL